MNTKQVIVMRKFPNLRTGKYIAQGAHASMGAVLGLGRFSEDKKSLIIPLEDAAIRDWLTNKFTKITVYVDSEAELIEIHEKARVANLPTTLIRDAGLTEFGGQPTLTAVGIGPAESEKIDQITGHLKLF
jgi:PTH2 family peptidyl-tRNA hydrolase